MTSLNNLLKVRYLSVIKRYSSQKAYQEVSIPVPWGEVRGKWWGPTNTRPILTFHGWQDNCGSFDRLIPLLDNNVGFLAVDWPGHGYSSHIPRGIYYNNFMYLTTIGYIKRYMQWPKISLLGHSLGGQFSYSYTMLYPDEIDILMCIDGAKPSNPKHYYLRYAKSLKDFHKFNDHSSDPNEPPSYTMEDIKHKVHIPNQGSIYIEYTPYIIERNVAPSRKHPDKYYFTRDPRLKAQYDVAFHQDAILHLSLNMKCPIFIAKCLGLSYYEPKELVYEVLDVLKRSSKDCVYEYVDGSHHMHLNNPERVADHLNSFMRKHITEDRSVGGLKPEMIVTQERDPRISQKLKY